MLLGQGFTQRILREHLAKYDTTVETETELREFQQDAEGVTATLVKHQGGVETAETIRLRYLVGTDGGRSTPLVPAKCIARTEVSFCQVSFASHLGSHSMARN